MLSGTCVVVLLQTTLAAQSYYRVEECEHTHREAHHKEYRCKRNAVVCALGFGLLGSGQRCACVQRLILLYLAYHLVHLLVVSGFCLIEEQGEDGLHEALVLGIYGLGQVFGGRIPCSVCLDGVGEYLQQQTSAQVHKQLYLVVDRCHLCVELVMVALVVFLDVRTYGVSAHVVVEEVVG